MRVRRLLILVVRVESAGLLQYLFVPALLAMSVVVGLREGALRGSVPLIVGLVAGILILYRRYYTSLGS
jgi:hypothetical protein